MNLLRTFDSDTANAVVHTRAVARVHIRIGTFSHFVLVRGVGDFDVDRTVSNV